MYVRKIQEALDPVSHIREGNRVQRFLSASRDEDALKEAADCIAKAMTDFQV